MRISIKLITNLKVKEVKNKVKNATEKSLKNTVVAIANDAIKGSPKDTGNNMRSIKYEAKGMNGAVFSTSGYGGYLETGTSRMPARPYFKPALDRNIHLLPKGIKAELR
jgi:HK97 gp10 family phage protein